MEVSKCVLEGPSAAEMYVTVVPPADAPPPDQVRQMFSAAAAALREAGASVLQERLFAAAEGLAAAADLRAAAYGDLADAAPPSLLLSPPGGGVAPAGLQVHAVRGETHPETLPSAGPPRGGVFRSAENACVALSGLTAETAAPATDQARAIFQAAEGLLQQAGGSMRSVARTWVWLGDILPWYDDFNAVRNRFYADRGLTAGGADGAARMPASTGIGVRPVCPGAGGAAPACGLDVLAVTRPQEAVHYLPAAGRQQSAYVYGSAFSRAAWAETPGGRTVWVSGTAAIDAAGASRHDGDAEAQIDMTVENVRAVLGGQGCRDEDVVQAVAYCKTPAVLAEWRRRRREIPWPAVDVISDVCRAELLFEIEATACPGVRRR